MNDERADPLVIQAEDAHRRALANPRDGWTAADTVAAAARADGDDAALAVALRAAGWAARELHDHESAQRYLDEAVRVARRSRLSGRLCAVLITRSAVHLERGRLVRARTDLQAAREAAHGDPPAELAFAEGLLERKAGDFTAAARAYRRALAGASTDEPHVRVKALNNLALVEAGAGRYEVAERHLRTAARIADDFSPAAAAIVAHNRAGLAIDRGDPVEAMRRYEAAEHLLTAAGLPLAEHHLDKSRALLALRLLDEAAEAADRAVNAFAAQDAELMLAEALMPAARIAAARGRDRDAAAAAARAEGLFRRQRRPGWRAAAALLRIGAQAATAPPDARDLDRLRRIERTMLRSGNAPAVVEAALLTGQLSSTLGRPQRAASAFRRAAAAAADGPILVRLQGRLAAASEAELNGTPGMVGRLCHQGLAELTAYRATFASTELRARAAGHGAALAELGLRSAWNVGDAERIWTWIERGRAAVHVRYDRDASAAQAQPLLAELRTYERQLEQLAPEDAVERPELLRRIATVERRVRATTWTQRGRRQGPIGPSVRVLRSLRRRLGGRVLVQYGQVTDRLLGVAVRSDRIVQRDLGPVSAIQHAERLLAFALRSIGAARSPMSVEAATASARAELERLDGLLLSPFGRLLDDTDEVIVVAPGSLIGIPWAALRSVVDRPVRVVSSATSWLHTAARAPLSDRVVLAAGPDLSAAGAEIDALTSVHDLGTVEAMPKATCAELSRAAAGAAVVHMACHGRLRADSPTFSALRLHDGPLTVHDLEHLSEPVHHWVLASCDLGASGAVTGPQLEGLLTSLLEGGAGAVLAAVASVPDASAVRLMLPLHRALVEGHSLPAALCVARQQLDLTDPADFAVATVFCCYGGG